MKVVKKVIIGLVGLVSGILSIFLFFFNSYRSVFDSLKTLFNIGSDNPEVGFFDTSTYHLTGDTLTSFIVFFISFPIMIICIRSLFKK
jgi:hypothetical protein